MERHAISSQRTSVPKRRFTTPAAHPAHRWHTGLDEGPYAAGNVLSSILNEYRPSAGVNVVTIARPTPIVAQMSDIRWRAMRDSFPVGRSFRRSAIAGI